MNAMVLGAVVSAMLWLTACSKQTAEDQIREQLAGLVAAVEAKDRSDIKKFLAPEFAANSHGRPVDPNLLMMMYFRQHKQIHIQTYAVDVAVQDRTAQVQLNAVVMGGQDWLPERVNVFEVGSVWARKNDASWQVSYAEWQRLDIAGEDIPSDVKRVLGI